MLFENLKNKKMWVNPDRIYPLRSPAVSDYYIEDFDGDFSVSFRCRVSP